ncbi:MAG TPA: MmcQ/YjbR family DNA-binding protein [Candidatus Limnocylindria bacterium]|nr:MmcQ/YjbR family DNA-binding protein [Candidatus Limnocylindria bacterium]
MATQGDVRRIALSLPGTSEDPDEFRFLVEGKMFVWLWPERVAPKRARVPNPNVIVVRVGNDIDKQVLLAVDSTVFFTEPHYDGYAAVLVRLPLIDVDLLTDVVTEAWRCRASKRLRAERDG